MLSPDVPIDRSPALAPGDVFDVSVYGEKDLSGKFRIGYDGAIEFPLVGRLQVGGRAPGEIAEMIRAALVKGDFLRSPNVSVLVINRQQRQATVIGAVSKPGSYPLTEGMSVVELLGAAGGLTPLASGSSAVLTRTVGGHRQRFKIDIDAISQGRAADVQLQAGDIVYVPERVF